MTRAIATQPSTAYVAPHLLTASSVISAQTQPKKTLENVHLTQLAFSDKMKRVFSSKKEKSLKPENVPNLNLFPVKE